jgi:calcineurin-like phosphoesterase family protein
MDKALIKNWNSIVKGNDIVWFLGDLSFHNSEKTKSILSRLKGRKFMIKGNHDKQSVTWYRENGFEKVYDHPIVWHERYILSHAPINGMLVGEFFTNIHGHIHNNLLGVPFINVGVSHWDYTPVLFNTIINKENRQLPNGETHHDNKQRT